MKKKNYYMQIQPWHFILAIFFFYLITIFISEIKLKKMPEAFTENSFPAFNGEFSEDCYSFIFFYDDDSEICHKMRYQVKQFAGKTNQEIQFFEVNVNTKPEYYYKFNVSGVPNILIFKNNQEVMRVMGIVPEDNLEKIHQKIMHL